MDKQKKYDVVVIGAGVAGLCCAIPLAQAGQKVLIISKKNLKGEATPASAGILDPLLEMNPGHPLLPICKTAFRQYPRELKCLEKETRQRIDYKKTGMLYVAMNAKEAMILKKRWSWQRKTGIATRWMNRSELFKIEPNLSPKAHSGLFYPSIGRVNPRSLQSALIRQASRLKIDMLYGETLPKLDISNNKVSGLSAGAYLITTSKVINAAGAWASQLKSLCICPPVLPARGQILIAKGPSKIQTILHSLHGAYIVPWGHYEYLVGSNVEFSGYKPEVTAAGLKSIQKRAEIIWPLLKKMQKAETWAGLRPYPEGGIPYMGSTRIQGYYLAAGYYRSGILISHYVGRLLARAVLSGKIPKELRPFDRITRKLKPVNL